MVDKLMRKHRLTSMDLDLALRELGIPPVAFAQELGIVCSIYSGFLARRAG